MRHLLVPAAALLLAASAQADYSTSVAGTKPVAGDGQPVKEVRYLEDEYTAIICQTPVQLEITVDSDSDYSPSLAVSIDDNLQGLIRLRERDKTLYIDSTGGWTTSNQPVVHLKLRQLDRLDLQGGAGASVDGYNGGQLNAHLGSGMLEVRGKLDTIILTVDGNGDARLQDAETDLVNVSVNGGGKAIVNATRSLDATIRGPGTIRYRGEPEVTKDISPNGHLLQD